MLSVPLRLVVPIDFWTWSVKGAHVMALCIFLLPVRLRLVFGGTMLRWVGLDLGCPRWVNLSGPVQHVKAAILSAWRYKVAADLCGGEGFPGGPLLKVVGSLQLLNSAHVRERDKALLWSVMVGGVWNGFLFGRVRGQPVP